MTGGTIGRWIDLPVVLELLANLTLGRLLGLHFAVRISEEGELPLFILRLPLEVEDLIERAQVLGWVAVTIQTPRHAVRFDVTDDTHLTNIAVAALAAHPTVDVHRVVEVNVIGSLVNSLPLHRQTIKKLII